MKKALSLILSMLMLVSCTMFVSAATEPAYENDAKVALVFDEPEYDESTGTVTVYLNMFFEESITEVTGGTVVIDYDETKLTYQTGKKKSKFVYNDDEEFESTYDSISLNPQGDIIASFAATDPTYSIEGVLLQVQFVTIEGATGTCDFSILEASGNATTMYVLPDGTEDGKWQANTVSLSLGGEEVPVAQYTVTYENAKGAAPEAVTADEGTEITVADAPAAVEGFTFEGWTDGATTYDAGDKFTLTADVTLTAVWEPIPKYTVTYENAKGDAPEAVTEDEGTTITVAAAPATVEGFTFGGWTNGETTYQAGQTFELTGNVTLTAVWEPIPKYTVTYVDYEGAAPEAVTAYVGTEITVATPATVEHSTFIAWGNGSTRYQAGDTFVLEGDVTLTAIREAVPQYSVFVYDGDKTIASGYVYEGEQYTLPTPERVVGTRVLGFATTEGATVAEYRAGDKVTINDAINFYVVREEVELEEAYYTFEGRFDVTSETYSIDMYYEGPQANQTAFGVQYDTAIFENLEFAYSDTFMSTGTDAVSGEGYIADVAFAKEGNSFGDDLKTPVLVGTFTADMTAEQYAQLDPEADFVKYVPAGNITGAFENDEWQFIKNEDPNLDPSETIFPILFTTLVDNDAITITTEGVDEDITTVTVASEGKMLEAITFTAVTAEGETPANVSYTVAGESMGALVPAADGFTYTIPAEKVLGDVVIIFSYLPAVEEVVITEIDAPVAEATPDTEATAGHDTYTVESVEWVPADDTFEYNTEYTVNVTVKAVDGKTFSGETTYTINGQTATLVSRDGDTVVISYTFEKTAEELGAVTVIVELVRDAEDEAYKNFGTIKLLDADGDVVGTVTEGTEAGDTFVATFENVQAGEGYTVAFEKNGYLKETSEAFEVVYDETNTIEFTGVAGNVYGIGNVGDDNEINLYDFARIVRAFEEGSDNSDYATLSADAEYNGLVDVNEDGIVDVYDLVFVKINYKKSR